MATGYPTKTFPLVRTWTPVSSLTALTYGHRFADDGVDSPPQNQATAFSAAWVGR